MKLYARRGFEWAEDGLAGLWSPVLTGGTQGMLLDCNPSTNNHGTLTGYTDINTGWVGSPFGTVLNFNGSTNNINTPATTAKNTNIVTVVAWFKTTQATLGRIVFKPRTSPTINQSYSLNVNVSAGKGNFIVDTALGSTNLNTTTTVNTGDWFCLAGSYNGVSGGSQVFLNGVREASGGNASGDITYVADVGLILGSNNGNTQAFTGQIAEAFVLLRPSTVAEHLQAFQAGPGGMWQDRPRRSRVYFNAAGFRAYWARRQSQLIGGGV